MKGLACAIPPFRRARCIAALAIVLALIASASCGSREPDGPPTPTPSQTNVTDPSQSEGMSETAGVTPEGIIFGQSAAFSGPARELGINMRLGIQAAFAEANRAGGVHGRQLSLVSLDDT